AHTLRVLDYEALEALVERHEIGGLSLPPASQDHRLFAARAVQPRVVASIVRVVVRLPRKLDRQDRLVVLRHRPHLPFDERRCFYQFAPRKATGVREIRPALAGTRPAGGNLGAQHAANSLRGCSTVRLPSVAETLAARALCNRTTTGCNGRAASNQVKRLLLYQLS